MMANVTQASSLTTSNILLTMPGSRSSTSGQRQTMHPVCLYNGPSRETAEHRTSWFDRWFREGKNISSFLLPVLFISVFTRKTLTNKWGTRYKE